jgi:DNA-binding transcriptional MerR regulator
MDEQEKLLTIQQLGQDLTIPKPTIRYWEKEFKGILVPVRTRGGQRRHSGETISVIEEIKRVRERGMSLPEIKRTLRSGVNGDNSHSNRIDLLAARVAEIVKAEVNRLLGEVID